MSLLLYLAVLLVSAAGVIFGMDWVAAPSPHYRPAPVVVARGDEPPPVRHLGSDAATRPIERPQASAKTTVQNQVQPRTEASAVIAGASPPLAASVAPSGLAQEEPAPAQIAAAEPPPRCDIQACEAAYISFNASDCTYQPSSGPRRLCEKGNPPRAVEAVGATVQASASPPACNVEACQRAYFTFSPADCTYQPSQGPRRLCTKR